MADWFDRIRNRYQGAMNKPQRALATLMLGVVPQDAPPVDWAKVFGVGGGSANAAQAPGRSVEGSPVVLAPPSVEGSPVVPISSPSRQGNYGAASAPAPVAGLLAPTPSAEDMAYVPKPANQAKDNYGPAWSGPSIAPPPQYSNLNPTPSLDDVFRREYAANPNGFTPGRFFGLFGS